jgi:Protein of unknown function (DUF4038)/Putative collagen-binding domain of a collagenase
MPEKITKHVMPRREFGALAGATVAAVSSGMAPGFARLAFAEESAAQIIQGKVPEMIVHNAKLGVEWPLRISANGNYLEDQNGKPFQICADAGWELTTQISDEDAIAYLDDRLAKGFNAVEIRVIGRAFQTNAPNNYYDESPFTNGTSDWSVRNEAYWVHVDTVLRAMRARGMVAVMFPCYLGYGCGDEGWCQQMVGQTNAAMTDYGAWIGARYNGFGNVIWMTGGDCDASNYTNAQARCDAMVSGVLSQCPWALFGAEPNQGQIAGIDSYASTVDINCVYEYNDVVGRVQAAYNDGAPFMLQESSYENEHGSSVILQKSIALITLLGGGLVGQCFGTCPLWNFGGEQPPRCDSSSASFHTWQDNMASPGSYAIGNIGKLMRSRKWWTLLPDYANAVVPSFKGSGDTAYHATARETTGETVMVWCPSTSTVTVDMTKIAGSQTRAWSWNPTDNSSSDLGTFATSGSHNFSPTAQRVLVLDSVDAGLAAPGTTVYR